MREIEKEKGVERGEEEKGERIKNITQTSPRRRMDRDIKQYSRTRAGRRGGNHWYKNKKRQWWKKNDEREGEKKGRREFRPNFYYAGQTHGGGGLLPSLYCIRNARNETNVFRTAHGLQYDKLVCLIHPNSSADYALPPPCI